MHGFYPWSKIEVNNEFLICGGWGSIITGIDSKTGIMNTSGYTKNEETYVAHPTTGIAIEGFQIPRWDELLELADNLGRHFPSLRCIAWDVVLSKRGWCVMEGNYSGSTV